MPTPVGHSLIGAAMMIGRDRTCAGLKSVLSDLWSHKGGLLLFLFLVNAPDIDYIPGILQGEINSYHHLYTHTLGWILLVATGVWLVWKARDPSVTWRLYVFLLALLAGHLVADWLTEDRRPPYGIMAFWPLTDRFFISPVWIFPRAMKANWGEVFRWHNLAIGGVELVIGLVLVGIVAGFKLLLCTRRQGTPIMDGQGK